MSQQKFTLLGFGRPRSEWLGSVSAWATSGAIPAEFAKCVSSAELKQRLSSLRPYSALLIEADLPDLDRDLLRFAARAGVPTLVIDRTLGRAEQWLELGAAATIPAGFTPEELLRELILHAPVQSRTVIEEAQDVVDEAAPWRGHLIAVCGPGGTGASTIAIALAQGFAEAELDGNLVVLADLARNGEQAMLHDVPTTSSGIEELVDACRTNRPVPDQVRAMTSAVLLRNYRLLIGQRRIASWTTMPPAAVDMSIDSLRRSFRAVIADVTADFEGESDGGSSDVEERNAPARSAAQTADVVVVVGSPDMKGTHSLARTIRTVVSLGVAPERVLPVINRSPKSALSKVELTRALATLVASSDAREGVIGPVFVPERKVDAALRDGTQLPNQVVRPVFDAVTAMLSLVGPMTSEASGPVPIGAGTLGLSPNRFE